MKIMIPSFLALLLIQVSGCGDDRRASGDDERAYYDRSGMCISGIQVPCSCNDRSQGVQICRADGLGFGDCQCVATGTEPPGASAGTGPPGTTPGTQLDAGEGQPDPLQGGTGGSAVDASQGGAGGSQPDPQQGGTGGNAVDASQGGAGGSQPDSQQGGTGGTDVDEPPAVAYASGIRISEVAFYQGPKIPLVIDGQHVAERNAPVVIGRDAMLRVFVEPLSGWQPRDIRVTLQLESNTNPVVSQEVTKSISSASREESMESTINFKILGDEIVADLRYAISLLEAEALAPSSAPHEDARWPREFETTSALSPRAAGPVYLMLVPYRYMADGSGRLPSTSDEDLETYKAYIREHYPITQIDLSVHEPVDYANWITSNTGWEQWLDYHCAFRDSERPDPKLVYYGLLNPADTMREYGGGIAGISYVPSPSSNIRCSVGLGFGDELSATTMTHEVGHSFGLEHAPCGLDDAGPFPYADAKIGTWAYIMTMDTLLNPNDYYDLMSYCSPTYISDYNYQRLFQRIRYLNMQFMRIPLPEATYHRILMDRYGILSYRGTTARQQLDAEEEPVRQVELFDAQGRPLGKQEAFWMPFSLEPAGVFLLPEQDGEVKFVQIDGTRQRVALP